MFEKNRISQGDGCKVPGFWGEFTESISIRSHPGNSLETSSNRQFYEGCIGEGQTVPAGTPALQPRAEGPQSSINSSITQELPGGQGTPQPFSRAAPEPLQTWHLAACPGSSQRSSSVHVNQLGEVHYEFFST